MGDASTLGRAALTIGGAYFFGPVGSLVGGFLGNVLFPAEGPKGPRLTELNVQHSTVGAPIPIVYGTSVLAGNVIWSGGLAEHEHEGGGKGSPPGPTSYSYSVSFAVGICEGPIVSVRRIWFDADLVYDASDDTTLTERLELGGVSPADIAAAINAIRAMSAQLDFTLYLGDETQLPDPTIESFEGVGLTPSYRGLAYLVFTDLDVTRWSNRIPNVRFEVVTAGTPTECGQYSPGQLLPWNDGLGLDPRFDEGVYEYSGDGGTTWYATLAEAGADLSLSAYGGTRTGYDLTLPHGFSGTTCTQCPHSDCHAHDLQDRIAVSWWFNSLADTQTNCTVLVESGGLELAAEIVSTFGLDNVFRWAGEYQGGGSWLEGNSYWVVSTGGSESSFFEGQSQPGSYDLGSGRTLQFLTDVPVRVRRSIQPPDPCSLGTPLAGAPGYCVVGGQVVKGITWTPVSGTFKVLQRYFTDGTFVTQYPLGPALPSTDPNYNDQDYWEAAYAAAVAEGVLVDGDTVIPNDWVYGVDYPTVVTSAYFSECDTLDVECVPMAVIVADICRRAGLRTDTAAQIDVSDLTTCVIGYVIGRQMSARDALQPLRTFGLWDAVESDALLRFVERGHALVRELTADDLGAHENGSEPPSAMEVARTQEKELPRRVRLHFANFLHDHEASEQSASRITTEAVDEVDIELPISMEPDTAKQLAEISLFEAWVSRNGYTFSLDNNQLALEPTDCIEIVVDNERTERVRIVSVDYKIGGILQVAAVRDDDGAYVSTVVANPGTPSGGIPGSTGGGPICPSGAVLLDIPCLEGSPPAGEAWIYAALYGLCPDFWSCAELYRSNDSGVTYQRIARADTETTVGTIDSITGPPTDVTLPGDSPPYDTTSAITVTLAEGTLSSVTDAQIAAGQNLVAIGQHGRWVIIQFKTATLDTGDTWTLTDLIWGVNDTIQNIGSTVAGDSFVLLSDSGLLRISVPESQIGTSISYKVATCGETLDSVSAFSFTTRGLCFARLCPPSVISATLTTPPTGAADGDAYLLPNDTSLGDVWADHGGEIAKWSDATDSWVFCTPAPGTVIHIEDEDDDVISGGDGTTTPAPWTPAIPPLPDLSTSSDLADTDCYSVVNIGGTYYRVPCTDIAGGGSGSGDVTGPGGTSTDNAIVRWDGSTGDTLQDSDSVLNDADEITTPNGSAAELGFKGTPQNSQTSDYTLVLADAGKCIYKGSGGAVTITIPANSSVAFPVGTAIEGINDDTENLSIAITTDTLVMYRTGATGTRTVAARGYWQIRKVSSTRWFIGGDGVT